MSCSFEDLLGSSSANVIVMEESIERQEPKTTKVSDIERRVKSSEILSQIRDNSFHIDQNKKWLISVFLAFIVMLICSSYTVKLLDNILLQYSVDIFNVPQNEFIMNIVQFFIVLALTRLILEYSS